MSREVPAGRFFCMDEFHNHHMNDDVIRERLRSIDGISPDRSQGKYL